MVIERGVNHGRGQVVIWRKQMNRLTKLFLLSITFALISACSSNQRVQSNYDADVGLSDYKTYNFVSTTAIKDPDASGELQLYFSAAVENQMLSRGLVKSDTPDILIDVVVDLEDKTSAPMRKNSCPRYQDYYSWYIVPIYEGQSRPTMCVYKEGSVQVEMVSAETNQQIFEGLALVRLDRNDTGPFLVKSVLDDVAVMFDESSASEALVSR